MSRMTNALQDVDSSFMKLALFDTLLNSLIVFLVVYMVLALFDLFPFIALIPATTYFVIIFLRKVTLNNVQRLENKFPALREKLSAAADSSLTHNEMADALHHEVLHDLSRVEESAFFDEGKTYMKTGVIVALCFAIIILAPFSFGFRDSTFIKSVFDQDDTKEIKVISGGGTGGKQLDDPNIALKGGPDDIFGERSIAQLGEKELTLELRPVGHEITIRDVRDAPDVDFYETYPGEIASRSSLVYEETIAQEHQELVKRYFTKLAEEG